MPRRFFKLRGLGQTARAATDTGSASLAGVRIQLLPTAKAKARARRLLAQHHYLGDVRAVGEQLFYALPDARGDWLGVVVFCAGPRLNFLQLSRLASVPAEKPAVHHPYRRPPVAATQK